jgi:hypothetical protein
VTLLRVSPSKYFCQKLTQTILSVAIFVHALHFAAHNREGKRIMKNDIIFNEVDQLGELLGEIKRLQDRADAIKAKLKDKLSLQEVGADGVQRLVVNGAIYKATCNATDVVATDTKKLYAHYGITEAVLANFKKKPTARYTVEISINK